MKDKRLCRKGIDRGHEMAQRLSGWKAAVCICNEDCPDWFKTKSDKDLDRYGESLRWVMGKPCPCCESEMTDTGCGRVMRDERS